MGRKKKDLTIADKVNIKKHEEEIKENLNLEDEKVVIEEKSKFLSFISILSNIFMFLLKAVLILAIAFLSTVGATVLFNSELREMLYELVLLNFFN